MRRAVEHCQAKMMAVRDGARWRRGKRHKAANAEDIASEHTGSRLLSTAQGAGPRPEAPKAV